jgi:hypothetical protein
MPTIQNASLNFLISEPLTTDQIARISRAEGQNWKVSDYFDSQDGLVICIEASPTTALELGVIAEKSRLRLKKLAGKPDKHSGYNALAKKIGILFGILGLLALPGCTVARKIRIDSVTVAYKDVAVSVGLSNR